MAVFALLLLSPLALSDDVSESGDTQVDVFHDTVSESVTQTAAWLDAFFADDNYEAESNDTSARWSLRSFSAKGDGTDFSNRFKVRLRLPRTENRMILFISGESDDLDTSDSLGEEIDDTFSSQDEENLSIGLRYSFLDDLRRNVSARAGARFRSGSPVVYLRPRYRYFREFTHFDLRFIQQLTWFSDTGLESKTELQLERPVWDHWFFRGTTKIDWFNDEDGVFPAVGFNWRRSFDDQRVVSVGWSSYFETQPQGILDSTVFKVRYRKKVWRKWLWFEVAPQISFPREDDYDAKPGLLLELEAEFRR